MNWKDLGAALLELLKNVWQWLLGLARRHSLAFIGSAIAVLALSSAWSWYKDWSTTEYTLLVGPGGSTAEADARRIRAYVEKKSGIAATYRVTIQETEGFEEVRTLINADETGRLIGFGHDGFGNAENIRILLPLDRNCLHVVARRKFLAELFAEHTVEKPLDTEGSTESADRSASDSPTKALPNPITFADLVKHQEMLRPGRFSIGPRYSGTRQLAELVMKRYNLDAQQYQSHGISDWHDMRAAFNNGSIDVAFYSGRMDAKIIQDIAADGKCVLIGLDGDRDAIIQGQLHLQPFKFEENSYAHNDFCPAAIQSFSSRRVLLCSAGMSESTAYFLASSARDALRPVVPEIDWVNPPPDSPRAVNLTYRIHPGVERLKEDGPLVSIPWNSNYILLTLALWLATELVQWGNKKIRATIPQEDAGLEQPTPTEPTASSLPTPAGAAATNGKAVSDVASIAEYDLLNREIEDAVHELVALPKLPKEVQKTWHEKIGQWRLRIDKSRQEGRLSERHHEALTSAVSKVAKSLEQRTGQPYDDGVVQAAPVPSD